MMFGRFGNGFGPGDGAWGCFGNCFWGYGFMGPLMMLGFILITALVVYLIFRSSKKRQLQSTSTDALNLLQIRFVKGEITEEEYLQKKNLLSK